MNSELVAQTERALLGSIMLDNSQWSKIADLNSTDFSLSSHSVIFGCMAVMFEDQKSVDNLSLAQELNRIGKLQSVGDYGYLATLLSDGTTVVDVAAHGRYVKESSTARQFRRQQQLLGTATSTQARSEILSQMQDMCSGRSDLQDWQALFHTRDEIENAPPLNFAIDGFLQEDGITLIGGLAGHGKTLCMLAMVRALLEQGQLFTKFQATRASERVLYLIPEAGIGPFSARLRTFRLMDYLDDRLFVQTLSTKTPLTLNDRRLLKAAEGADIFLDTAVRFMQGDENDASEQRAFAESLFNLQAAGARTITGAHHSPKAFSKDTFMTLENVLRGSGDIGAMLCTAWGLKQIDPVSNSIFIANVKPRDFQPCEPFIVRGRPSLDQTGYFEMTHPPGFAGNLSEHIASVGRPTTSGKAEKQAEARKLLDQGLSYRDIAEALDVKVPTLHRWLKEGA